MTAPERCLRSDRHDLDDVDIQGRVAASLIRNREANRDAVKQLKPEHFSHPAFALIFLAILAIETEGQTATITRIKEHLVDRRCSGSVAWICTALDGYVESADEPRLPLFVEHLRRRAEIRSLLAAADRVETTLEDNEVRDEDERVLLAHEEVVKLVEEMSHDRGAGGSEKRVT